MFATTFVKFSEKEYELRVDQNLAKPTATWLSNQKCEFTELSYRDSSGFRILGITKAVLQRLSDKYPPIFVNDNLSFEDFLIQQVELLRNALSSGSWENITKVTKDWTKSFKERVWKELSQEEKIRIRTLSLATEKKVPDIDPEDLQTLEPKLLRTMVTLLKDVKLIGKDFKLAHKTDEQLFEVITSLLPEKEDQVKAAFTLVKAMN